MTNRVKLWLGASTLALLSGVLPAAPGLSPVTTEIFGVGLAGDAWAQESGDESGEGEEAECPSGEEGEGEEGGGTECPSGEEGEGEGG